MFLATFTDYSQLFEWFESVWQVSLQWYHSCVSSSHSSKKSGAHFGLEFAKIFIVLWTCARLRIGQELSRIKAPSGSKYCYAMTFLMSSKLINYIARGNAFHIIHFSFCRSVQHTKRTF